MLRSQGEGGERERGGARGERRTTPRCFFAHFPTQPTLPHSPYTAGFVTDIESDTFPKGLDESVVRAISAKKNEPDWMLDFRLRAYRAWLTMPAPRWVDAHFPDIDFQDLSYYSAPRAAPEKKASLDEVDPELLKTFEKLGIPLNEQKRLTNVAVDAVFDSVSIATTFKKELSEAGVIFMSLSEAVAEHPDLVRTHLGSVVPPADNYYAALNSAVFSDGSFVYVPKGVASPMEISTYFRINAAETGQFERTLIVCEDGASVSYLEGCTAPSYDKNQLHAAVVELRAGAGASIKYSTVQNWYAGDAAGVGGIYNFVTKRGLCAGADSKISWTQVRGSVVCVCVCVFGSCVFFFFFSSQPTPPTPSPTPPTTLGRNRVRHHLEVSLRRPRRRPVRGRVLQRRPDQRRAASRYGHQNDPCRQGHPLPHRVQRHFGGDIVQRV